MRREVKSTAAADLMLVGDMGACMASCIFISISMTTPHTAASLTETDADDEVAWYRGGEGRPPPPLT
jgi:hypothetical protein